MINPISKIQRSNLKNMVEGWFVGAFTPTALSTKEVEVAVKMYPAGYKGEAHHHKIATEVTVMLSGRAVMAGEHMNEGDIITLLPGISSSFEALDNCIVVVVKTPGNINDKYIDEVI